MITPMEIKAKAERIFPKFIRAWLDGESGFFPRHIPANLKLSSDHAQAFKSVESIRKRSKEGRGFGYSIEWETQKQRIHGLNLFPIRVYLETEDDLIRLAEKEPEFGKLQMAVPRLLAAFPHLDGWLNEKSNWKQLVDVADEIDELLLVTRYLIDHPRPGCFAREIPIRVSTKLMEENKRIIAAWLDRLLPPCEVDVRYSPSEFAPRYGLKHVRQHFLLRVLDDVLQQELGLPFPELSLPIDSLRQLPVENVSVFIVENKVNLLTFPTMPRALVLGGLGKAVSLLRDVAWMVDSPIFYWGDYDAEGFEMLSQIRGVYSQTESVLMDRRTFEEFQDLSISWPNRVKIEPANLTDAECRLYVYLRDGKLRLEQERIPQRHVEKVLAELKSPK